MTDPIEELALVLGRIRSAVLAGDFHLLETYEQQVEALRPGLTGADPARLEPLVAQASANQRLLLAASRGVRSAQRRLAELSRAMEGFQTYDPGGQLMPAGAGIMQFSRRF